MHPQAWPNSWLSLVEISILAFPNNWSTGTWLIVVNVVNHTWVNHMARQISEGKKNQGVKIPVHVILKHKKAFPRLPKLKSRNSEL